MKNIIILFFLFVSGFVFAQTSNMPLHEVFTSSTCGPCVAGNQNLSTIFDGNPDRQTVVKYQMSWPGNGDPYYTSEGGTRQGYYNVTSVPRLLVDGGWDANPSSYTSTERDAYYFSDTYVSLEATHTIGLADKNSLYTDLIENAVSHHLLGSQSLRRRQLQLVLPTNDLSLESLLLQVQHLECLLL